MSFRIILDSLLNMNDKPITETIDDVLKEFDLTDIPETETKNNKNLSVWIPAQYKDKYDEIQRLSRGRFGKLLREVVVKSIDKVKAG